MTRALTTIMILLGGIAAGQSDSILSTPHNLSVSGAGTIRAAAEQEVCVFCHTPHHSAPVQPLWNRSMPAGGYSIYSSNSLDALPGQPTGSSKLCLSCHDGTIALGNVLSRSQAIRMAGSVTTLPPGTTNLGTDLSDDHPVSFTYDNGLAARDPKLRNPDSLPAHVRLDANRELQCTSCHEPHNNLFGNFLVMDNSDSRLCRACHRIDKTTVMGHGPCDGCHQPHSAPSGPYLLKGTNVRTGCLKCHDGRPGAGGAPDIARDLLKTTVHDTDSPVNLEDPIPDHVGCSDCHEPHTMTGDGAAAPVARGSAGAVTGVSLAGTPLSRIEFEYEICFKCHADVSATQPWISRDIVQNNTRLEFGLSAISYHPVAAGGRNSFVPSLKPGFTPASRIYCTDCHSSDTGGRNGGRGPNGPHGSNHPPLLVARYETTDGTAESAETYALCYRCHRQSSILGDDSFRYHSKHVVEEQTPCSVCHDAHGIAAGQGTTTGNSHLINFDTAVVFPRAESGLRGFTDLGSRRGSCTLLCHGEDHQDEDY